MNELENKILRNIVDIDDLMITKYEPLRKMIDSVLDEYFNQINLEPSRELLGSMMIALSAISELLKNHQKVMTQNVDQIRKYMERSQSETDHGVVHKH